MNVTKAPLYQQVYQELRRQIASGELAAGDWLDINNVARAMDISATPVREAVRQLVQEGLVEVEQDRRARVYAPTPEDLAEIYTIRAALEASAAAIIASSRPLPDLSELEDAIARGEAAHQAADRQGIARANTDFHEGLIYLSGNRYGRRFLDSLRIHIMRYRTLAMQYEWRRAESLRGHRQILELIRQRQVDAVHREIYEHIMRAGAWTVAQLKPEDTADTASVSYLRTFYASHDETETLQKEE